MTREQTLHQLASIVVSRIPPHPLRVAIDGIDAAGKTTLADELAPLIEAQGRPVIRASIDGFHQPRSVRYQREANSAKGYYEDSFDYASLRAVLLQPLGPHRDRRYQSAIFDVRTDTPVSRREEEAPPHAVLLFDGVFLLRHELADLWDYQIFVFVRMETALQRALHRDLPLFGSAETVRARYMQRYLPGQRLYYQTIHPQEQADVIVDNNDSIGRTQSFLDLALFVLSERSNKNGCFHHSCSSLGRRGLFNAMNLPIQSARPGARPAADERMPSDPRPTVLVPPAPQNDRLVAFESSAARAGSAPPIRAEAS